MLISDLLVKFVAMVFDIILPGKKKDPGNLDFTKELPWNCETGYAIELWNHFENTFEWATIPTASFQDDKGGGHTKVLFLSRTMYNGWRIAG